MSDATAELLAERGKTHGLFSEHALITQTLKGTMHEAVNWDRCTLSQRESLEMIVHKIGRILAGDPNHKDHWDDIAGYARLVADQIGEAS